MKEHNLPEKYFEMIIEKSWTEINITIDEKGNLLWDMV